MSLEEFVARALAAKKLGLEKDVYGTKLPEDIWGQALWEAQFVIHLIHEFELRKIVEGYYKEDGDE